MIFLLWGIVFSANSYMYKISNTFLEESDSVLISFFVGKFHSFCMDEEKCSGKSHKSLKAFVDSNPLKFKDVKMIISRAWIFGAEEE